MSNNQFYIKTNVSLREYKIHNYVYNLNIVKIPKIYEYNVKDKTMKMEKIPNMNIADMYGEEAININNKLFNKIRKIIKTLYLHNIEYIDITGYNFIEYKNKVWIIDFEHASFKFIITNKFLKKFIKGENKWNEKFE